MSSQTVKHPGITGRFVAGLVLISLFVVIPLASSPRAQSTAPPPGVYKIDPDPATTFPGDPVTATAYIDDYGAPSCLRGSGSIPRLPSGGFTLGFPDSNPQVYVSHPDPWESAIKLLVSNQVPPGPYSFNIWVEEFDPRARTCMNQRIGNLYDWDVIVVPANHDACAGTGCGGSGKYESVSQTDGLPDPTAEHHATESRAAPHPYSPAERPRPRRHRAAGTRG